MPDLPCLIERVFRVRIRGGWFLAPALLIVVAGCSRPLAGDRLNDEAAVLLPAAEERIAAFQLSLLSEYDVELAVDIPKDPPPDLEAYAHRLMQKKRVGSLTGAARGVLLLIDVNGEVVRLEVGTDLEHVLPDAFVSRIERNQMAPFFREGRVGDGIEATVELIVAQVAEAVAGSEYVVEDEKEVSDFSTGGGARARTPIGLPQDRPTPPASGREFPAGSSPADVMASYVEILALRDGFPYFRVYTPATRAFLASRLVTPAQQDNEHRRLMAVLDRFGYVVKDSLAVARVEGERNVPPYFFRRGRTGWMLDLVAQSNSIRFDHQNRWFVAESPGEYAFAFR